MYDLVCNNGQCLKNKINNFLLLAHHNLSNKTKNPSSSFFPSKFNVTYIEV
jgi:hypothetical protein